ncbi:MAG: efflux transporter outer membrane subunit [Candidatus Cryptobacteroides sp.]
MKKTIILSLAVLALSGCGLYKKYDRSIELPDTLFGQTPCEDDSLSFALLDWRELFADPCLQALIDSALCRNTDLAQAELTVHQAQLGLKVARLGYLPSFNIAADASLSSTPAYTLPVAASWQIDLFGTQTNTKRQSEVNLQMSRDYAQAVQSSLVANVASQYYTLLMLDAQLDIARNSAANFEQSVKVLRVLKGAGMSDEIAVAQMEAALHEVNAAQRDISEAIVNVENALCSICRQAPQHIGRGVLGEYIPCFPEEYSLGFPVDLLENRPDVRAAEMNLAAAFYQVNISKAALLPSLKLGGTLGWTNLAGAAVSNPGSLILAASASLLQPLFNAGALTAQLEMERDNCSKARLAFEQTVLDAGAEVNDALAAYQLSGERLLERQAQVASLEKALEKTRKLMQYSSGTYLEVLTAERSLLSARTALCQEQYNCINATVRTYLALGGGAE